MTKFDQYIKKNYTCDNSFTECVFVEHLLCANYLLGLETKAMSKQTTDTYAPVI